MSEAGNGIIEWTSSNTDVVVVNNGSIQALKSGEAIMTAKFKDYNISKEYKITVFDNSSTTDLVLNTNQLSLKIGEKYLLSANVGNDNLRWVSSNESVVQVNNGEVVAMSTGTAVINVAYGEQNVVVEVVVSDNITNNNANINEGNNNNSSIVNKVVNVSSVSLNKSSVTMFLNESVTLTAIISPSNATNKNVTWSSSNKAVVTVKNGVVSAVGIGKATVTVVTKDGKKEGNC